MILHLDREPGSRLYGVGVRGLYSKTDPNIFLPGTRVGVTGFDDGVVRQGRVRQYQKSADDYIVLEVGSDKIREPWLCKRRELRMNEVVPLIGDEVLVQPGPRDASGTWGIVAAVNDGVVSVTRLWPKRKSDKPLVQCKSERLAYPMSWRVTFALRVLDYSQRSGSQDASGLFQWVSFWMPRIYNFFLDVGRDQPERRRQENLLCGDIVHWLGLMVGLGLGHKFRTELHELLSAWDKVSELTADDKAVVAAAATKGE